MKLSKQQSKRGQLVRANRDSETRGQAVRAPMAILPVLLLSILLTGCAAPTGADRVPNRLAYNQVEANPLSAGKPSSDTLSALHRYDLDDLFKENPAEALTQLHFRATTSGDRDLLYALAEISFVTAEAVRRSVKPWDPRDSRDYYLGAAVYAWLFLFGENKSPAPTAFDRRFRAACDLYNHGLGLAFTEPKGTNAVVQFQSGKRRLPIGEIDLRLDASQLPTQFDDIKEFLLSDQFRIRGLSVRNRQPGMGAALIAVPKHGFDSGIRMMSPVTAFLRVEGSLQSLGAATCQGAVEFHSAFGPSTVKVANQTVPLETDYSVHMAYALNQSMVWRIQSLQFLSLQELIPSGVYPSQPYERGRIPVVFVHGTFSSPIWWTEMLNTLRADPEIRQRYQFWFFIYNSSNPIVISARKLRESISARLKELDPDGTDAALQQMVVIGHSQGGLLTKLTATDAGDKLWRSVSDKSLDDMDYTPAQKAEVRRFLFLEPLPCVRRTVFISTPHRGSYRIGGFLQKISRRLVSIPAALSGKASEFMGLANQLKLPKGADRKKLTSIDGMSSSNPMLITLAEIPVAPTVKAHSIIPVKGVGDFRALADGVVQYKSAHVDYVESELILRHGHSCQGTPPAIEEVRRILHEHLASQTQGRAGWPAEPRSQTNAVIAHRP